MAARPLAHMTPFLPLRDGRCQALQTLIGATSSGAGRRAEGQSVPGRPYSRVGRFEGLLVGYVSEEGHRRRRSLDPAGGGDAGRA